MRDMEGRLWSREDWELLRVVAVMDEARVEVDGRRDMPARPVPALKRGTAAPILSSISLF